MSAVLIEPELREVLEDVVRQSPDSSIFARFTPTRFNRTFDLPDQTISIAQAGLSTAERELVRVHREKLAAVLREAFFVSFNDEGRCDWMDLNWQPPGSENLARKASKLQRSAVPEAYRYRTGHFIRRIVKGEVAFGTNDLSSMLIASLRLCDHSSARIYHACLDTKRRDFSSVWKALLPLLDSGDPDVSCFAREVWAKCLDDRGEVDKVDQWGEDSLQFALENGQTTHARNFLAEICFRHLRRSSASVEAVLRREGVTPEVLGLVQSYATDSWGLSHLPEKVRERILRSCQS